MPSTDPSKTNSTRGAGGTGRVAEMQNPLDRWLYHPIAELIARLLARSFITPNMVSVAGGLAIVLAGIVYIQPGWPVPAVLGLLFHMTWHVFDGADGSLARMTGKASPSGEIVDGICDYAGHIVLYLLLANAAYAAEGDLVWFLVIAAGLSRVLQANFYEVQRRQYLHWAYGVDWLRSGNAGRARGILRLAGQAYLGIARLLAPQYPDLDRAATDPERSRLLEERLRKLGPASLAGSGLLGANYRTLALGGSMIAGSPVWFFIYEAVVLNLVLATSVARSRRTVAGLRTVV